MKENNGDNSHGMTKDGPHMKVVWYLLITPRIKCLFSNPYDAKNLRWHVDERNMMDCFGADFMQCKNIDEFPQMDKNKKKS